MRVEQLAESLGVTKGGFYWHFANRGALLEEMLDTWERLVVDEVIEQAEAEDPDPRIKLRRVFALGSSLRDVIKVELSIRDWARREPAVARRLRRVDNRRMDYLRSLFGAFCADRDEVEVRCMLAASLFIGSYLTAADHAGYTRDEVVELALERLLA